MRKLRSDITREGLARTPHRAFMRAMGLDDVAIQKPMMPDSLASRDFRPAGHATGSQSNDAMPLADLADLLAQGRAFHHAATGRGPLPAASRAGPCDPSTAPSERRVTYRRDA